MSDKRWVLKGLQFIIFTSIGIAILYFLYLDQQEAFLIDCQNRHISQEDCNFFQKILSDISSLPLSWLFVVVGLYLISNIFRSLRWMLMIHSLKGETHVCKGFMAIMIGYFINLGIPRSGELARATIYSKYTNRNGFEQIFGTIVTERIIDMIMFGITIILAFLFEFQLLIKAFEKIIIDNSLFNSTTLFKVISSLVISSLIFYFIYRIMTLRFQKKLFHIFQRLKQGVLSIFILENPYLYVFYSVSIWVCYYLMTYLSFQYLDSTQSLSPIAGLIVFVFGTLGIIFPSPGGIGAYQFGIMKGLEMYNVSSIDGLSLGNIQFFTITILGNVIIGIVSLILLPIISSRKK